MSDPIDLRDYGALEAQVERLVSDVAELTASVQAMRSLMEQSKGGWKMLAILGGMVGTIGGVIGWFLSHIKVS